MIVSMYVCVVLRVGVLTCEDHDELFLSQAMMTQPKIFQAPSTSAMNHSKPRRLSECMQSKHSNRHMSFTPNALSNFHFDLNTVKCRP